MKKLIFVLAIAILLIGSAVGSQCLDLLMLRIMKAITICSRPKILMLTVGWG